MRVTIAGTLLVLAGVQAVYKPRDLETRSLYARPYTESSASGIARATRQSSFEPKAIAYFPPFLEKSGDSRPEGFITFQYLSDTSARIEVRLSSLPQGKGPFAYHIHTDRVPEDIHDPTVQCKDAKAHLDPQDVGETIKCDSAQRQSCQVGDVSSFTKRCLCRANRRNS